MSTSPDLTLLWVLSAPVLAVVAYLAWHRGMFEWYWWRARFRLMRLAWRWRHHPEIYADLAKVTRLHEQERGWGDGKD
jgi:hypothetical protein